MRFTSASAAFWASTWDPSDGGTSLLQYSHVADWNDVVRAMLLDCSMPPPDAGVPMPDEERTAILTWLLCGFPE